VDALGNLNSEPFVPSLYSPLPCTSVRAVCVCGFWACDIAGITTGPFSQRRLEFALIRECHRLRQLNSVRDTPAPRARYLFTRCGCVLQTVPVTRARNERFHGSTTTFRPSSANSKLLRLRVQSRQRCSLHLSPFDRLRLVVPISSLR
jgi:hypothetical protein